MNPNDDTGQLALGGLVEQLESEPDADLDQNVELPTVTVGEPAGTEPADAASAESPGREVVPDDEAARALAWKPAFDDGDDLGGLLAARSPLLSRAFRGADRDG